jgi:hypothetical protein
MEQVVSVCGRFPPPLAGINARASPAVRQHAGDRSAPTGSGHRARRRQRLLPAEAAAGQEEVQLGPRQREPFADHLDAA